jgi:hypothetical protein
MTAKPSPQLPGLDCAPLVLAATCELAIVGPAGWEPCPDRGAAIPVAGARRVLCPPHTRQLPGLTAAGLLERLRFTTPCREES